MGSRRRRPVQPAPRSPHGGLWLYGLHAVDAALRNPQRCKHRLLVTRNAEIWLAEAIEIAEIVPHRMDPRTCTLPIAKDAVHQGATMQVEPLSCPELSTVCAPISDRMCIIVLDRVTDPRNVGAILRSASAFGAHAVIATQRHGPSESGSLVKAACGAVDHIPYCRVVNLATTIDYLRSRGFLIVGLDADVGTTLRAALHPYASALALVIGSEDKGLRRLTRARCDQMARIHLTGPNRTLNASNAAAIALYAASERTDRIAERGQ